MANGWGLYYASGSASGTAGALVFDVDSVLDLKQTGKSKVSTFPVEEGAFASYNKVQEPDATKVRIAVGGPDRVAALQAALDTEKAACNLYNVVTPTKTYLNVTLEGYDHEQTSSNGGVSGLVVDLSLVQVREVTPAYATVTIKKPKQPASASTQTNGKASPETPAATPSRTMASVIAQADSDSNS
jgi:hypothetical protein